MTFLALAAASADSVLGAPAAAMTAVRMNRSFESGFLKGIRGLFHGGR
jgi:hypothetical protein